MRALSNPLLCFSTCTVLLCVSALRAQTPAFQTGFSFPTKAGPLASTTGDFNHDGHIDIAIANTAVKSVTIVLGKGDGTFGPGIEYSTGTCQPGQLITGDFNRDGHMDLLAPCTLASDSIMVLPGAGDGTFGSPIMSQAPFPVVSGFMDGFVEPLTSADVNGDGIPDLALIIQTRQTLGLASSGAVGQTVIMTGNGDGTFGHATTLNIAPTGTETYAVQLADVNGDGKVDIVGISFNYDSGGLSSPLSAFLIVALGDGKGNFQLVNSYPLTHIPQTGMMVADVNGDGKLDVVFAGLSIAAIFNQDTTDFSGVGVFLGKGDGSFTPGYSVVDSQATQNQATVGSALAPVFGTKYPDIIALMFFEDLNGTGPVTGGIVVRPNNGDGTFGPPQTLLAPSQTALPFSLSVADFNSDGRPDFLAMDFRVNLLSLIFNANILTDIDSIGQSFASFPSATATVFLNNTPSTSFTNANAASYQVGPLASSSIVSAFGAGLASSTATGTTFPLPLSLGGASVAVTDSLGVTRNAPLFYASPLQINYEIPDGTATGMVTVALTAPSGTIKVQQTIASVAPGLFSASELAAGQIQTFPSGSTTPATTSTFQVNAQGQLSPVPIDLSSGTANVFLILYGTGIRNHQMPVVATIGTTQVTTDYAGPQNVFVGEDQINIHLPQSLKGAGNVEVTLNVDGHITNPVKILVQ